MFQSPHLKGCGDFGSHKSQMRLVVALWGEEEPPPIELKIRGRPIYNASANNNYAIFPEWFGISHK